MNTNPLIEKIKTEPVLVTALVQAVIALAVSFGLSLSPEQIGGLLAVLGAALAFVARSKVTPTVKIDTVEVHDGHATYADEVTPLEPELPQVDLEDEIVEPQD